MDSHIVYAFYDFYNIYSVYAIYAVNVVKNVQGTRPLGAIILVKFEFFSVLVTVNPHP